MKKPYRLFCDMDGVLVNFEDAILAKLNETMELTENFPNKRVALLVKKVHGKIGNREIVLADIDREAGTAIRSVRELMYALVSKDVKFWATLDWMPDGRALWQAIKKHNPYILSAPMDKNCEIGKRIWVKRNLGISPSHVILTKNKHYFAHSKTHIGILIDDMKKYVIPFTENGGIAIWHKALSETLTELKQLGFE